MKQGFQILGILTLVVGSFLYSERVDTVSKLSDDLLKEIKDKSENYKIEKVSPIITDDTFIPGKNGKEVDINKSYEKMREIGYFYEKSLVYKNIKVKPSLSKNKDKFIISANRNEKNIALLFKVKNNYNLNKILSILDKNKIKGTFFIEIVRNNFYELENVSPNFRIADTTEIELLKQEVIEERCKALFGKKL